VCVVVCVCVCVVCVCRCVCVCVCVWGVCGSVCRQRKVQCGACLRRQAGMEVEGQAA